MLVGIQEGAILDIANIKYISIYNKNNRMLVTFKQVILFLRIQSKKISEKCE
jgi:hypothetical protein